MDLKIVLYAFVIVFIILIVGFRYLWSQQRIEERLTKLADKSDTEAPIAVKEQKVREVIKRASVYFESCTWAIKQEDLLIQARIPFRGSEFMVISIAVAVLSAALVLVFTRVWWGALIVGGSGFYIPTIIMKRRIKKRLSLFNEQLPMALTLMANSMRSGYSYLQAIDLVAKEMPNPLGEEFGLLLEEMNLGVNTEDAFGNLVKRVKLVDLDLTVTAFLIQRQVGGNLAELLDNIGKTIRDRLKMRDRISALTAQGTLSGAILCLLPVAIGIFIFVTNPTYITGFIIHPLGKVLIGFAVLLQAVGIFWMRKVIDIEM